MIPRLQFAVLRWAAFVVLALVLPAQALAQTGTVTGRATDGDTGDPIAGATVLIVGTAAGVFTDQNGEYSIEVQPGTYTLRVIMLGYATEEERITVAVGGSQTVNFQLQVSALLIDEIVAVGSRTARTALETPVPVDVISAVEIQRVGQLETNQILRTLAPSYNASHQTISDGTDHVNPASLRGLGPDQTLVLINGKRRHSSSLVNVNGTFGRGTVGIDLNAIPPAAIERIEILRDGASAQYGSDAIAGVINIVLKEQYDKILVSGSAGFNPGKTLGEGAGQRESELDGEMYKVSANFGFKVGERGYFNVTGDFLERKRTNRSGIFQGSVFESDRAADDNRIAALGLTRADFSMKTGQGEATVGSVFFNSSFPLGDTGEFYAFGGLTNRTGFATGFFRKPIQEERVVPELFANGFLPEIRTNIDDDAITFGIRGARSGWDLDISATTGSNRLKFNIENSNNASQGAVSPISFDAGGFELRQTTGNIDAVRLLDTGGKLKSLSVVLGGEFRNTRYEIIAGQPGSYLLGNGGDIPGVDFDTTSSGSPKAAGSQVFPGFQPDNEVDRQRSSIGGYVGLESEVTDQLLLDGTVRYEDYSDFGTQVTGKLAARFEFIPNYALRAAISNGFRAPSLNQIWFNNVSTQFVFDSLGALEPAQVLTANNLSGVSAAFGVPRLDAETSLNISGGITTRPMRNLSITVDGYFIKIDDRVVLSSRFSAGDPNIGGEVGDILAPFEDQGVSQAQFFMNAVDTETMGVDIVAAWTVPAGPGQLALSTAWNFTDTEVKATNVPQSMADKFTGGDIEAVKGVVFNREEKNRLETALPTEKGIFQAIWSVQRWAFTGRYNYFGGVLYRPDCGNADQSAACPDNDENFAAKHLFDLEVGFEVVPGARLILGGSNIFNTLPDEHELSGNRSSERFIFSRRVTQFGTNGAFYYGRIDLSL